MFAMEDRIILVDEKDRETGTEEKMKAHREGKLHRAFSIFLFNSQGEMLLQRRAKSKYHCGSLWSNTCCSHPRKGEMLESAAHRRLMEEMGIDCEIKEVFSFIYSAKFENGLIENELDHVFIGRFDGEPKPNPEEVDECKWVSIIELMNDVNENPKSYTPWFKIILGKKIPAG